MKVEEWLNNNQLSIDIWNKKYRYNNETLDEWFERVSGDNPEIEGLLREKKFLFGGRILANRGLKDRKITYSNCYVIAPPEDNLESIFECVSKIARTFSYGGGCGIDLSKLRPNGAPVYNAAKTTCGPVGFMDLFSQTTATIGQAGRRGALMISLDVKHPDILEFIDCKTDLERVKYANISVRVDDAFMKAVEEDEDYFLRWPVDSIPTIEGENPEKWEYNQLLQFGEYFIKKVRAREVFNKLVKNNWDYAEPGILYWDRISNYNMLDNTDFEYAGVNPCAEEPLPAGGSCLLGSINLSEFVVHPFTEDATINWDKLSETTRLAVRALNEVLIEGVQLHPLQEQQESVNQWRQIGLGTLGLADMLIKLGIKYGSEDSIKAIHEVFRIIAVDAVLESLDMAKEKGCYPSCDKKSLAKSSFLKDLLPESILEDIEKYGLFNSQLLTCAPTGSTATMLTASTGVEPNFALKYVRKTQSLDGKDTYYDVNAQIVEDFFSKAKDTEDLPSYFITSADINPVDRVKVQAELQKWIDASISSTINLPKEATVEDVYNIYMEAWRQGLKGITVYRSGCKREGILTTEKPKEIQNTKAPKRPKELPADLHMVKAKGEQFIVLVGLFDGKPYEVFAFRPNMEIKIPNHQGIITKRSKMHYDFKSDMIHITELELANDNIEEKASTLYSSMLLRHGVDIKYIIKTAKKVNDNISSFTSAVCRVLSKYIPNETTGDKCPECGGNIIREGGCEHCESCLWSRCE